MNATTSNDSYLDSSHSRDASIVTDSRASDILTSYLSRENILIGNISGDIFTPYSGFAFFYDDSPELSVAETLTGVLRSIGPDFVLKRPLMLKVTELEDEFRVEIPQLELYAFSSSYEEAIKEVSSELLNLCEVLFDESSRNLSNKPLAWKRFLQQFVTFNARRSNK